MVFSSVRKLVFCLIFRTQDIQEFEGAGILDLYKHSPSKIVTTVFKDEYNWDINKFSRRTVWDEISNRKEFFTKLGSKLNVQNMEDWYRVSAEEILKENRGYGIMEYYNYSPSAAIINTFPGNHSNTTQ